MEKLFVVWNLLGEENKTTTNMRHLLDMQLLPTTMHVELAETKSTINRKKSTHISLTHISRY